jgi:hypothetical protein
MKTIKTQNVSLPIELHEWVQNKMDQTKENTPWAKATFSSIVEHALMELQRTESESGKSNPSVRVGANALKLSESSATGLSTRTSRSSRKAG